MENMDQNQAVNILIQAANTAQLKGAFTLQEAVVVAKAIESLTAPSKVNLEEPSVDNPVTVEK